MSSPSSAISSTAPVTPPSGVLSISPQELFAKPPARRALAVKQQPDAAGGKVKSTKSRKRVNTAEKRATHNATERGRREALNQRFLDLARLLPSLANSRRPSKAAIVNASIAHVGVQRESRLLAAREIRTLLQERDALVSQVNEWRKQAGLDPQESTVESKGIKEVLEVEAEVFGAFDAGLIGGDGDDEEEMGDFPELETTNFASAAAAGTSRASSQSFSFASRPQTLVDFIGQSQSVDRSRSSSASSLPAEFYDFVHFNSSASNPSPSSFSQSPSSTYAYSDNRANVFARLPPSNEKVSSWAAETLYKHLHNQQSGVYNQGTSDHQPVSLEGQSSEGLDGLYVGFNPDTAALLASMAGPSQRSFPMSHAIRPEEPSKSYNFPAGPTHLFQADCFPPQNPLPLPSPAASFTSFASSNGNVIQTDIDAWRQLTLDQQFGVDERVGQQYQQQHQQGGISKQRSTSHPSLTTNQIPGGFTRFAAEQQHRQQLVEPTMEELREAVKIGIDYGYGASLASGAPAKGWVSTGGR